MLNLPKEKHKSSQICITTFSTPRLSIQSFSMDLIGLLDPSHKDHQYALAVICMSTGCTFSVHLKTNTATEVLQVYLDEMYANFGRSSNSPFYNGTEFKN